LQDVTVIGTSYYNALYWMIVYSKSPPALFFHSSGVGGKPSDYRRTFMTQYTGM